MMHFDGIKKTPLTPFCTWIWVPIAILIIPNIGHSAPQVLLKIEVNPGGSFVAQSQAVQGEARRVSAQNPQGIVRESDAIIVNQAILQLATLKTGIELRDHHMKAKYFEVGRYPTATFTQGRGQNGKFTGILTVHGVPQTISGEYEVKGNEVVGKFQCTLSQFKIPPANYMGAGVEDEVQVEVTLPVH